MRSDFPLPDLDWEPTRGFWLAAQREELAIPRCEACEAYNWYPLPRCRRCDAESLAWTPVAGRGALFSYGIVQRALFEPYSARVPYATGLVALEEDPSVRLVTLLVDCELASLRIDMPLRVVFRPLEFPDISGRVIAPFFAPLHGD